MIKSAVAELQTPASAACYRRVIIRIRLSGAVFSLDLAAKDKVGDTFAGRLINYKIEERDEEFRVRMGSFWVGILGDVLVRDLVCELDEAGNFRGFVINIQFSSESDHEAYSYVSMKGGMDLEIVFQRLTGNKGYYRGPISPWLKGVEIEVEGETSYSPRSLFI